MANERIDVVEAMKRAAERLPDSCTREFYDLSTACAAVAEFIVAANDLIPKGEADWRGVGDFEFATFGVFRKDWERFTDALTRIGGAA